MATHGQESWALTSLSAWRDRSLGADNSAEFVKSKQRNARRALLRAVSVPVEGGSIDPGVGACTKPQGKGGDEMVLEES